MVFVRIANSHRSQKSKDKSGVAPTYIYDRPDHWGGENCLVPVKEDHIDLLLLHLRRDFEKQTDWKIPKEFVEKAEAAFKRLPLESLDDLSLANVWVVFVSLLPIIEWD